MLMINTRKISQNLAFFAHLCARTPPRSRLTCTLVHVSWSLTWSDVAGQPLYKMELSESVQGGLRFLADPSVFDRTSFQVLVDVSFRSLLSSHGDPSVLGELQSPARRRLCLLRYFRCFPVWISKRDAWFVCLDVLLVRDATYRKPVSARLNKDSLVAEAEQQTAPRRLC